MKAGRLRRGRLVAAAAAVVVAVFVAASAAMFVWPASDRPGRADAIVVLGGDGPRDAMGDALVRQGVATTLAVSVGSPYDPCFHRRTAFTLICFLPTPRTTQGEARWIAAPAKARGWHRVVVVVSAPQATRARLRIRRCYSGPLQVAVVRVGAGRTVRDVVYEWGALLKALILQRGC